MDIFGCGDHFMSYLDGIQSTKEMAGVIATAREAGIRYVNLYSLAGALHTGVQPQEWLDCSNLPVDLREDIGPTPVGSVKAWLTGYALNSLFRLFVREDDVEFPSGARPVSKAHPISFQRMEEPSPGQPLLEAKTSMVENKVVSVP
jgi:hypothetical protein